MTTTATLRPPSLPVVVRTSHRAQVPNLNRLLRLVFDRFLMSFARAERIS